MTTKANDIYVEIGQRVRVLREFKKVTQTKLAKSIRSYPSTISKLEGGLLNPSVWMLIKVQISLGFETHVLFLPKSKWNEFVEDLNREKRKD